MPDNPSGPLLAAVEYEFRAVDGPGADATLLVHRVTFIEELSRPYVMSVEVVTPDDDLDVVGMVGSSVELTMRRDDHARTVFGIVTVADALGGTTDRLVVRLRVEPAFAVLRDNVTSRIFQELTVLDVVEQVLGPLGDYGRSWDLGAKSRGTQTRDYCVQYRESDLAFVSRLLEEEGIHYSFVHDNDEGHEVLTLLHDGADCTAIANIDGSSTVPVVYDRAEATEVESLRGVAWHAELVPSAAARQDYDFLSPTEPLRESTGDSDASGRTRRLYGHMGRRYITDDVAARMRDSLEAASVAADTIFGESNAITLQPGRYFDLDRHYHADLERPHIVTRVIHRGLCPEVLLAPGDEREEESVARYENEFEAVPKSTPLRPRQVTPKPRMHGPQTAIVTGPAGEEIHTDEHGRICVQFHWDEAAPGDDTSSCWIRVAQSWAGPGWGAQFIPRIGMEVLVSFLEGNPDRPVAQSCLYNGDHAPPFPLPDNRSQSGVRTRSTPKSEGFNELRFEDAAGAEEIFVHAEKDWNNVVEHDRTTTIHNDDRLTVDRHRFEDVTEKREIHVGGTHTETIDDAMSITVKADRALTVDGDVTETFNALHTQTIKKKKSVTVEAEYEEKVTKSRTLDAGGSLSISTGDEGRLEASKALTLAAGKGLELSAGADIGISTDKAMEQTSKKAFTIDCGDRFTLKAKKEITIECGDAKIMLKKSGEVVISGGDIKIKGSGDVVVKGSGVANN